MLVLTSTLALQHRKLHSNTELPASECYTQRLHDQPLNVGTKNCQALAQNPKSLNKLVPNQTQPNPAQNSNPFKKSSHSLNVSSLKTGLKALIYVLILTLFCVLSSLTLAVLLLWWNSPKTMKLDCRVCGKAYDRGADQPSRCFPRQSSTTFSMTSSFILLFR